ncbi:MAG: alanine--tRNA ligase [bacterium]
MEAKRIRAEFLEFFAKRQHTVVRSSSLIPHDDPTLLFTNAGMNQFKSVFLGREKRDYVRAASVQKCMRVQGKHNDLEEVGQDARHHTFFEMLGNWSFGDYYKRESIRWGWEFLTEKMGLPADRLWASVYKDDDEAFSIWENDIGLPAERIKRLGDIEQGDEENFWSMADTGPCGPCAEIHYDQGEAMACDHADGCALGVCDCDRWLELWNHVFMEFDRDASGKLTPLPMQSVDTGLGFERLVAVMQGVQSNYESDLFTPLIARVAELSGRKPAGDARISMQVIADHARAVTFTVTDGAVPANEGRGYVVRRILRRAARHGRLLDLAEPFLWRVAETVIATMGEAYPELVEQQDRVLQTIRREEERFNRTLDSGLQIYAEIRDRMRQEGRTELSGAEVFKLHDTFGFPVDLTAVVAREDGFSVDQAGFEEHMARQRANSGANRVYQEGIGSWLPVAAEADPARLKGRFIGYNSLATTTTPLAIREAGTAPDGTRLSQLLLAENPCYGEAGGQVGDHGSLELLPAGIRLDVHNTVNATVGPVCIVTGGANDLLPELQRAEAVRVTVAEKPRQAIKRHHTATHLLHAALRQVLGSHVEQAGSEVAPDKLRFDYRHDSALTAGELSRIEAIVNRMVLANRPVQVHSDVPLAAARARGAMALFGEKYDDVVRMVEIPGIVFDPALATDESDSSAAEAFFSLELCGGTHCEQTGDVGLFRIVNESSSAAGIRRIEAVAGEPALALVDEQRSQLTALAHRLRPDGGPFAEQVASLLADRDALRKELQQLRRQSAQTSLDDELASATTIQDVQLVVARVEAKDRDALMALGDHVRDKLQSGVVILAAAWGGKATLIATVTADLVAAKRLHAGNIVKEIAGRVGGRGGGRPNMAQAGLPDLDAIDPALAKAVVVVESFL